MVDSIFISVQYRPEEVNNGYWAVSKQIALPAPMLATFACTFFLSWVTLLVSSLDHGYLINPFKSFTDSALPLFVLIGIPLTCTLLLWNLAKQKAMQSYLRRQTFHSPISFILSSSGIKIQSSAANGTVDWEHLPIGFETDESFCIGATADEVFILPKRCFASAEEVKQARSLFRCMLKNFSHIGKGRADSSIAYEKAAIAAITIDGQQYSFNEHDATREQILPPVREVDKKTGGGIFLEVVYSLPEIADAETIHFFRKKLPGLILAYFIHALAIPAVLIGIGTVANGLIWTTELVRLCGFWLLVYIPVVLIHAGILYWVILRRLKNDKSLEKKLTFQISEDSCGLRFGEKFSVLAWTYFQECWETELAYILLYGAQGRAMWVIPKRAFTDRMAAAAANDLLKRKVANYKELS